MIRSSRALDDYEILGPHFLQRAVQFFAAFLAQLESGNWYVPHPMQERCWSIWARSSRRLLAWHRRLITQKYDGRSKRGVGRLQTPGKLESLIL